MWALLLLGSVLAYQKCDNVTSCYAQVNGTRGLHKLVGTLPNGGLGYSFTTQHCMRGLIAISESCECQNVTMHGSQGSPKFCYSSGDWAKKQYTDTNAFCSNQNGLNTFSLLNSTEYTRCVCFDPVSGTGETASLEKPFCKKGKANYKPCVSTDGTGDNGLHIAYTGATLKALMDIPWSGPTVAFPKCACGTDVCRNEPTGSGNVYPYCQADINTCASVKVCPEGVFEPKDTTFADQICACGSMGSGCSAGMECQTKEIDGIKRFHCTLDGKSADLVLLIKEMFGSASMTFVFALVAVIIIICILLFSILTCCKVNKK